MIFRCPQCRQDKLAYHEYRCFIFKRYKIYCNACHYSRSSIFKRLLILDWLGDYKNIERIYENFY